MPLATGQEEYSDDDFFDDESYSSDDGLNDALAAGVAQNRALEQTTYSEDEFDDDHSTGD
jgi:hypothetical protein